MKRLNVAIFDLTDCEGCELQFISLREQLVELGHELNVSNWRLANTKNSTGPFDLTFIEGSPITDSDIEAVKQLRRVSKRVVTLGTCAEFGGVQASLPREKRETNLKDIYGGKYKVKTKNPKPVKYYIEVDAALPGCPINPAELLRLLSEIYAGKDFEPCATPVCLECKLVGSACLFLDEGFCMGPVTKGGCGAPCPKAGLRCYGCFGPLKGSNIAALKTANRSLTDKELNNLVRLFFSETPEYQEFKLKKPLGKLGVEQSSKRKK